MSQSLSSLLPSESRLTVRKDQEGVFTLEKKRNHNPQPFFSRFTQKLNLFFFFPFILWFIWCLCSVEASPSAVSLCVSFGSAQCLQRLSVVCRKGNAAMISFPVLFFFYLKQKEKQASELVSMQIIQSEETHQLLIISIF